MTTAAEVGKWLCDTIMAAAPRRSYQSRLVRQIRAEFGEHFSYRNQNDNWAIDRAVLAEFNKLKTEYIVWDSSDQSWRLVNEDQLARIRERAERRAALRADRKKRESLTDDEPTAVDF